MFYLAAVNIIALRLPNVDAATNNGIHHAITPSILSANVYAQMHKTLIHATWLQYKVTHFRRQMVASLQPLKVMQPFFAIATEEKCQLSDVFLTYYRNLLTFL